MRSRYVLLLYAGKDKYCKRDTHDRSPFWRDFAKFVYAERDSIPKSEDIPLAV